MQDIINLNNKREPDQKLATEAAMSLVQLAELRFNWDIVTGKNLCITL